MTRLLHTRSKIFFPNPYVVRVEYERDMPMTDSEADYRKLTRRAYKLISGTWGYSSLEYEELKTGKDDPVGPIVIGNPGIVFISDFGVVSRGYACFKDEDDALQFRLMNGAKAIRVHMWPAKRLFTIHEMVEDEL